MLVEIGQTVCSSTLTGSYYYRLGKTLQTENLHWVHFVHSTDLQYLSCCHSYTLRQRLPPLMKPAIRSFFVREAARLVGEGKWFMYAMHRFEPRNERKFYEKVEYIQKYILNAEKMAQIREHIKVFLNVLK